MLVLRNGQAQTEFGFKAGLNMSRMASGSSYSEYIYGLNAGIYFHGTSPVTVQIEMLYSGQGGGFPDLVTGQVVERRLHYLSPILLCRYQPVNTFALVGGLQMGVLINAVEGSKNISDNYDPMDLGLSVGVEYVVLRRVNASLRFSQSLRNIGNQVMQFSFGYTIQVRD
jgi:hypothetical protein